MIEVKKIFHLYSWFLPTLPYINSVEFDCVRRHPSNDDYYLSAKSTYRSHYFDRDIDVVVTMKGFLSSAVLLLAVSNVDAFAPTKSFSASGSALASSVDDKTEVREYFNTEGFNRWNKIYSESDEVNSVQLDIRTGHDQTIQKILNWVEADGDIKGKTVCDCGCGVGSLAIPLAQMGKCVCFSHVFYLKLVLKFPSNLNE